MLTAIYLQTPRCVELPNRHRAERSRSPSPAFRGSIQRSIRQIFSADSISCLVMRVEKAGGREEGGTRQTAVRNGSLPLQPLRQPVHLQHRVPVARGVRHGEATTATSGPLACTGPSERNLVSRIRPRAEGPTCAALPPHHRPATCRDTTAAGGSPPLPCGPRR